MGPVRDRDLDNAPRCRPGRQKTRAVGALSVQCHLTPAINYTDFIIPVVVLGTTHVHDIVPREGDGR